MRFILIAVFTLLLAPALLPVMAAAQGPPRPAPIPAPSDVAAPPKDAVTLPRGWPRRCCSPAPAQPSRAPPTWSRCTTPAGPPTGRCSTARVARNAPSTFPLDRVIKGWGEGVQLMMVGEKRRFWIPEALAYKGRPAGPPGMLVFDIELLEFMPPPTRAAARRGGPARRREADAVGPGLQGASRPARAPSIRRSRAASRCTTPAGRPTARCSTARSCAARRPRSASAR